MWAAAALIAMMAGFIAGKETSWPASDVTAAYRCGYMKGSRDAEKMGVTDAKTEEWCRSLATAGWSKRDHAIAACFDIRDERERDDCFHKL